MALTYPGIPASTLWRDKEAAQSPAKHTMASKLRRGRWVEPAALCSKEDLHPKGCSLEQFTSLGSHIDLPYDIFPLFFLLLWIFFSSNVVYFKFSSPVERPYPTYVLQIIGPTSPSKCFNSNHLFSVQREGLQPCGIFLHSLKSSLLSGEESVSDVNVVLRVFKVF